MPSGGCDKRWMRLALSLGRRQLGRTWPNPSVGCVLVKNGRIAGRGTTGPGGRPHAETEALRNAGEAAKGSTAYVTLEPCAHTGETPPCARSLAEAGISRAVIAVRDPDPRVSGKGIEILKSAGIEVASGVLEAEARWSHRGFFSRIEKGLPSVTLKLAMSFDGKIAAETGDSKWITQEDARRRVHLLRACHDAVMVGHGTAAADDPNLAPRGIGPVKPPVRIIIDSRLETSCDSRLGRTARNEPVWLCHGPDAVQSAVADWRSRNAETILCRPDRGMVDLNDALGNLAGRGLTRIFCEGGSALAASLIGEDLVDELVGFSAGAVLGAEGIPSVGGMKLSRVSEARRYHLRSAETVGADIMHRWVRAVSGQE